MLNVKKFSIICDLDGRILSFNNRCEKFFNLMNKNVIRIERVYNLINVDFIFYFIDKFLYFKSSTLNSYKIDVVLSNNIPISINFKRKNNKKFIILEFFDTNSSVEKPNKSFLKIINFIFRSKFTLGSIIPFIFSFFLSFNDFDDYSLIIAIILFFSLYLFHVAANTFNDYFDWKSGRDKLNIDYVLFSTGGSRAIDLKIVSEKKMLFIAILSLIIVFLLSMFLIFYRGVLIFYLGFIGFLCVYFYSAPPIHLASRYGLGELMHIICLGPLMTYGCAYALTGISSFLYFIVGFPFGLLITCCLLLNEVPDSKFDKLVKKNNLAVVLGVKNVKYLFIFLLFCSFIFIFTFIYFLNYICFLFVFLILPYLFYNSDTIFNIDSCNDSMGKACIFSFYIYLYISLILIFSVILNYLIFYYPW